MGFLKLVLEKIWWLVKMALSEGGTISFGRTISAVITAYFLCQDAWFFHRTGNLVDNGTLLTQAGLMTMFYLQTKAGTVIETFKKDSPQNGQ